jgi:hypothetical protein
MNETDNRTNAELRDEICNLHQQIRDLAAGLRAAQRLINNCYPMWAEEGDPTPLTDDLVLDNILRNHPAMQQP